MPVKRVAKKKDTESSTIKMSPTPSATKFTSTENIIGNVEVTQGSRTAFREPSNGRPIHFHLQGR